MKHVYELYITNQATTADDFKHLNSALYTVLGTLADYELHILTEQNIVRFLVASRKDIGSLGSSLQNMILRPVSDPSEVHLPHSPGTLRFLRFVTGGNVLDTLEKYKTTKQLNLQHTVFNITLVSGAKALTKIRMYFEAPDGVHRSATRRLTSFPAHLLEIDFSQNSGYLKREMPVYLDIEKSSSMFRSDSAQALFEVDGFPYLNDNYYINLHSYDFDKHSMIVGASGSGKSKLISLLVDRIAQTQLRDSYRVVVIDPHASIAQDFAHIAGQKLVEFGKEGAELFSEGSHDIQAATELTATLFKDLLKDDFNPRLERVLRFSLYVLFTAQAMSLENMKRLVTDLEYRNSVLTHIKDYVPSSIMQFFGADFNEMKTQHYNEAISPIVNLVDEMQLQAGIGGKDNISLAAAIQDNFLTTFSLNKVSMGEKAVKTVAGLLIQQIFLLAQSRTFNQRVILIIDEVSVVQNPALEQILSEARKFNLSVILTQQYLGQVEDSMQQALFANVVNYYVFKVSEQDARILEGNIAIELPDAVVKEGAQKSVSETDIRVKLMTELHQRECLLRASSDGMLRPSVKVKTVEINTAPNKQAHSQEHRKLQSLPEKFVEKPSLEQHGQLVQSDTSKHPSVTVQTSTTKSSPANLSELLAQNSSSRNVVNKDKNL